MKTGKSQSFGPYQMAGFVNQFGKPVEKEVFERAIRNGKVFVSKVDNFDSPDDYFYHESAEALTAEYNERVAGLYVVLE